MCVCVTSGFVSRTVSFLSFVCPFTYLLSITLVSAVHAKSPSQGYIGHNKKSVKIAVSEEIDSTS